MSQRSLIYDLKLFSADSRLQRNILSIRAGASAKQANLVEDGFTLGAGEIHTLQNVNNTISFCLYSTQPVGVVARIDNNIDDTLFENQTLLTITSKVENIEITNSGNKSATVYVARLGDFITPTPPNPDVIPRQQVTFAPLSRVTALPQNIQVLANVRVEDTTLEPFYNDQVTAPGTNPSTVTKFRICNADGTPNATGSYLMILDDNITQQNFTGTLQFWIREIA